jgi:threonine/homoserine/homoserine lactone efflux protein
MLSYAILGATFAFAAAVQPGPLQTYLVSRAIRNGWRRTLPAAFSPLVTDGPIILFVLLVLRNLPPAFLAALQCAGGLFLFYLAWSAARSWRRDEAEAEGAPAQRSLFDAVVVNLLNPNPYLGWSLVMGPLLLRGWHETPSHGIALLAGFYATMVTSLGAIVFLSAAAHGFGRRISRALIGVSAIALAAFGAVELWQGAAALWRV